MPPFSADGMRSVNQFAVDHQATSGAGADNDAKHGRVPPPRATPGLRQGKAIGVVFDAYFTLEAGLQIARKRPAIHTHRIRIA